MNKQNKELLRMTLSDGNRGKLNYKKLTHKVGVVDYICRKYFITEYDEFYYDVGKDRPRSDLRKRNCKVDRKDQSCLCYLIREEAFYAQKLYGYQIVSAT